MPSILDTKSPLLWRACLAGEVTVIDKLMEGGADPQKTDRNGETCLHMCARSGEVDAMERMVDAGLDLNTPNHNGQTPLHIAVSKGHNGVVRYIVRHGGDTDLKSKFSGMTALHLSCLENDMDIAQFLLDNGADCSIQDAIGKYADNYTTYDSILSVFESHFTQCRHGRKQEAQGKKITERKPDRKTEVTTAVEVASVENTDMLRSSDRSPHRSPPQAEREESEEDVENEETPENPRIVPKEKKRRSKRKKMEMEEREGVKIYDNMEHYEVDRVKQNWSKAKNGGRKIKINHSLGFSDQHRQRMSQNVFDRLLGGKK